MSGTPDAAGSDSRGFTCSALLMCLYLPGLSKKKPEAEVGAATSGPVETAPAPGEPAEQGAPPEAVETAPAPGEPAEQGAPPEAPSRAASLEKSECASLYSGNNIVFDFLEEDDEGDPEVQGGSPAIHGYCPSPCFDLPVEMISRAGERFGAVAADSHAPVTAAFAFGDSHHRGGALKKMASYLPPGADGHGEPRPPNLVRFLSASGRSSSVPRPPVMPSHATPQGNKEVGGDCELGDGACVQRLTAGCRQSAV